MTDSLLLCMPCWEDDAPKLEALIDWIYQLNARTKAGHALILCGPGVHGEYVTKLGISADVTFEGHTIIHLPPWTVPPADKKQGVNYMAYAAARAVRERFNWPWLWLEPDCVPLKRGWLTQLAQAYHGQPKRYMGTPLQVRPVGESPDAPAFTFLSRTAVYPPDAVVDLEPLCKRPEWFERNSVLLDKAAKNRLIQTGGLYNHETTVIREDAVLFHSDKQGELIPLLRDKLYPPRAGAMPLTALERAMSAGLPQEQQKKIDGRTREARAAKKAFRFAGT